MPYTFGSKKQLVLQSDGLFCDGRPVKAASGKNLAVLLFLVERHGDIVSFDDLIAHVWKGRHFLGKKAEREAVTGTIYSLRKLLKEKDPEVEFIDSQPNLGYCFIAPVDIDSVEIEPHIGSAKKMTDGLSEVDTIHVHVDGAGGVSLIESLVDEFNRRGWPSSKNTVLGFIEGPQRKEKPHIYSPHTPGGLEAEELAYFSTHLFGNFAATKRECHALLDRLHESQVEEIVIEAERVVGKLGYPAKEIQWSNTSIPDFSVLCSGDVGYKTAEDTEPIEIHFAADIPKKGKWAEKPPFDPKNLEPLVALSSSVGIKVGGWFVFDKEQEKKWAYRSNMFETQVDRYHIENNWRKLKSELSRKGAREGFDCLVRALIEHSIGIWKTPLKRHSGIRTVEELSAWERNYPNLREFWVVTPNFLGDTEKLIQEAMSHNLRHRGVFYTYFLRSITDYNRLVTLAEDLNRKTEHTNVWNRIRAVILVRDASDPRALEKIFAPDRGQGCFIANPDSNGSVDDEDGYILVKSKDTPGQISGGKVMRHEQVKEIVKLLQPLISNDNLMQVCRPLQGFCMSLRPPENKEFSGVSVVCIGLKELPDLLNDIDDEESAGLLREYDLLIASLTSQFNGHVARSIETGYLLVFNKQDDAFACAEQIHKDANRILKQRIAIDCGDVWRVMRAHGNEYCGKTVSRCRELLKRTKPGQVTMTHSFADELPRSQAERVVESEGEESTFTFNKKKIRILTLN